VEWLGPVQKVQIKVMTKNDGTRSTDYCHISQPSSTHWFQVQTQILPEVPSTLGQSKRKETLQKTIAYSSEKNV
jgi:hypothetical protein